MLVRVFLRQLQCLEFVSNLRLILKFCVLQVSFPSEGNSPLLDLLFTVPVNDFWDADTSEDIQCPAPELFHSLLSLLSAVHV